MKTPGQKAYEAWKRELGNNMYDNWGGPYTPHDAWHRIAAAVTAPESKSLGQLLCEAQGNSWEDWEPKEQEEYESTARSFLAAAKERGELP